MRSSKATGSHASKGAVSDGQILALKNDEVTEYAQPTFSWVKAVTWSHQFTNDRKFDRPYKSENGLVTLKFGKRMESYSVPVRLIEEIPELEARQDFMVDRIIWLTEIDEDVGHTLVHYLYTGEYQTLRESEHKRHTEYKRSVLVYCAASNLEMVGLGDMALGHMEHFANSVDIYQILNLAKTVYRDRKSVV